MTTDDDLRTRLHRLAASRDVAELDVETVIADGATRASRRRLGAVAAVLVLVLAAAGVVATVADGDGPDVASGDLVASDDASGEEAEPEPDVPAADDTDDGQSATTSTAAVGDAAAGIVYGGDMGWVVPWGAGFLANQQVFEPSDATMADLVPDIGERLPPAVIEALGDVTGIDEATALLSKVGLLDEATAAVTGDPVLYDAYNQVVNGGIWRSEVSISPDGTTWNPVRGFAPPVSGDITLVRSDGTRLVLVEHRWNDGSIRPDILVHTTTDLASWVSIPIDVPDAGLPSYVQVDRYPSGISLLDDGWHLSVTDQTWIDLWAVVPDDLRAELENAGWSAEEGGLRVLSEDMSFLESSPTQTTTAASTGGRLIPWSEVGIGFDDYQRYNSGEAATVHGFLGTWDGGVRSTAMPTVQGCCTVVGTDAGLLALAWTGAEEAGDGTAGLYFSPDGDAWREIAAPPDTTLSMIAAVDDGVVALGHTGAMWRGAADGTAWTRVEIDGLPADGGLSFDGLSHRGVAAVVDLTDYDAPLVPYTVEFDHAGHSIRTGHLADGSIHLVVTEAESGEVVRDETFDQYYAPPPDLARFSDDGAAIELLDDDGEVVLAVPFDLLESERAAAELAARESAGVTAAMPSPPDLWLVASRDGLHWRTVDLSEEGGAGFGTAVVNGDVVVVRVHEQGWERISIS